MHARNCYKTDMEHMNQITLLNYIMGNIQITMQESFRREIVGKHHWKV